MDSGAFNNLGKGIVCFVILAFIAGAAFAYVGHHWLFPFLREHITIK